MTPERCESTKTVDYSPRFDVPREEATMRCELEAGHLIQHHRGHAFGHEWFWNEHAHGIVNQLRGRR